MPRDIRKEQTRPAGFEHDVFLSHSQKDTQIAHPLAERLLKAWLDEREIGLGNSISEKSWRTNAASRIFSFANVFDYPSYVIF
ncbi:MAG: hypothetical protein ACKVII_15900 [Planctomycetales bacterium]